MPERFTSIDLADLSAGQAYDLLVAAIQPRPIAFVSTLSADGQANLAPFSFFMLGGSNPGSLMISPVLNGKGEEKDSLKNIRETREFVVNTVHRPIVDGMNQTSRSLPRGESEWPYSGFTALPSDVVKPDRVAESLAQFECRLFQVIEHGNLPGSARYVIGEIVRVHVTQAALQDGIVDADALRTVARLGGAYYLDGEDLTRFELPRPQ